MNYKYVIYLSLFLTYFFSIITFNAFSEEIDNFNNKENTYFWLGLDYLKKNNFEQANFYFKNVLKINPKNTRVINILKDVNKPCNYKIKNYIWAKVNIKEQKVYICNKSILKKVMLCSTAKKEYIQTPTGIFYTLDKTFSFYTAKYAQTAKYWVGFTHDSRYGFHSIPIDNNNKEIKEERKKLGTQASHGCIRLSIEDAEWFYNSLPLGTLIDIS